MYNPRRDSDAFEFYGPGSLQSTYRRLRQDQRDHNDLRGQRQRDTLIV